MVTKKDDVQRAARELYSDKNFAQRVADRAEAVNYLGYETMIKDGKELFMSDFENFLEVSK